MRRHVRGHTHSDAGRSVQQKQRSLCGQHSRLLLRVIEVKRHVHGVLVDVSKDIVGHLLKLGLGVPHGCHRVTIHGAEVTLAENHGITLIPRLRKPGECIVDAGVAVRVILSKHLTDDLGALTRRPRI